LGLNWHLFLSGYQTDTSKWKWVQSDLNGPFFLVITVNNVKEPKPFSQWTIEENKRAQYDVRARNIISSTLSLDEFYRILVCTSA